MSNYGINVIPTDVVLAQELRFVVPDAEAHEYVHKKYAKYFEWHGKVGKVISISKDSVGLWMNHKTPGIPVDIDVPWALVQLQKDPWNDMGRKQAVVKDPDLIDIFETAAGIRPTVEVDVEVEHPHVQITRRSLFGVMAHLLAKYDVPQDDQDMLLSCFDIWIRHQGELAVQTDRIYGPITKQTCDLIAGRVYTE